MNSHSNVYRSTLVAAALAVGCFGAVSVAAAHEHDGWDRDGYRAPRAWHDHGHRGWEHYRPARDWRPAYREPERYDRDDYGRDYYGRDYYQRSYYAPPYPPVAVYRPAPPEIAFGDGRVSVMIRLPL